MDEWISIGHIKPNKSDSLFAVTNCSPGMAVVKNFPICTKHWSHFLTQANKHQFPLLICMLALCRREQSEYFSGAPNRPNKQHFDGSCRNPAKTFLPQQLHTLKI